MKRNIYGYLMILGFLLGAAEADNLAIFLATKALALAILWFSYKKGFAHVDNL